MQIRCPNCGKEFDLSGSDADKIRQQIRTHELEAEVEKRMKLLSESEEARIHSAVIEAVSAEKDKYVKELESLREEKKDAERALISEKESAELKLKQAVLETEQKFTKKLSEKDAEIRAKTVEAEYYKDLKAKMSTKMIGESLERHCETEFNKIRMAAFPRAQFGKDNTVSRQSGSKGDYIFREYDESGAEIISIMFEMKNEADQTATKKTNDSFFKELDKDRIEKNCEYAVLVSLLEAESELYNQGIVDVSYQYPKMYVIRPQFFIPMITLLRNAALTSLSEKQELARVRSQNLDIAAFRDNFEAFKKGFSFNWLQGQKRLAEAVEEIDKTIKHLEAVKASLTASDRQFSQANKKADEITIEKLCKNSPMLLEELKSLGENE